MGIPRLRRLPKVPKPLEKLSENHWTIEAFKQRMTVKSWRQILLDGGDLIFVAGRSRHLVAKRMGFGIVEISKAPLREHP